MRLHEHKGQLLTMALLGSLVFSAENRPKDNRRATYTEKVREKPVPKGTTRYYFDQFGAMYNDFDVTEHQRCVFQCVAISENRAREKYKKFLQNDN